MEELSWKMFRIWKTVGATLRRKMVAASGARTTVRAWRRWLPFREVIQAVESGSGLSHRLDCGVRGWCGAGGWVDGLSAFSLTTGALGSCSISRK